MWNPATKPPHFSLVNCKKEGRSSVIRRRKRSTALVQLKDNIFFKDKENIFFKLVSIYSISLESVLSI
jgi:hypothetical protein